LRHLWCSPAHSCESIGLGDDSLLLGEGGNGSGSRRCAHEVGGRRLVCVGLEGRPEFFLWETGGGRGWYRQSDPSPQSESCSLIGTTTYCSRAATSCTRWHARPLLDDGALHASHRQTACARSAAARVLALWELWFIIAAHSGGGWLGCAAQLGRGRRSGCGNCRVSWCAAGVLVELGECSRARCGGWIWGRFGGSVCLTSRPDVLRTRAAR